MKRRVVRPYLALARVRARAALAYRLSFALSLFALLFQLFAMLAIWRVLLDNGRSVAGFTWPQMEAYLLVGFFSGVFVSQSADWHLSGRIQNGMVALDLTKPVDYQTARFAEITGAAWAELVSGLVVCAGVLVFVGGVPIPDPATLALFALSMLTVLPLKFLVVYLSSLAAFYTQNYLGVHWARLAIVSLLSGALVPLAFFPEWLQVLAGVLPFASLASTPGLIFIGKLQGTEALWHIGLQFFWVAALWIIARLIWSRAVRRVTIHGG